MCDGKNGFEKTKHRFPYEWTLKDANFTKDKGTVFNSIFEIRFELSEFI